MNFNQLKENILPISIVLLCIFINLLLFYQITNGFLIILITIIIIITSYCLVSSGRQTLRDLQPKSPILTNGSIYLFIESITLCFTVIIFYIFNLWNYNSLESSRYLFSAIIQSEAAILSIIITLSLIGIQLIAQKYTTYVIDLFKKYPDLWIILIIYASSIIFGVFSLFSITGDSTSDIWNQTYILSINSVTILIFNNQIISFTEIFFFTLCLASLIPYFWNILTIFRPENILQYLKFNILNTIPNSDHTKNVDLNSYIISIFDIINASYKNNDRNTTFLGFLRLTELIREITNPNDYRIQRIDIYLDDFEPEINIGDHATLLKTLISEKHKGNL